MERLEDETQGGKRVVGSSNALDTCKTKAINPVELSDYSDPSCFSSVQFSRSIVSNSMQPHESPHARPPCPITNFRSDLGSSSFSILSFCLFILFMGLSRQEYWSGLYFPSPGDHILSDLSTMTRPSWVAPQAWLSFIELDKAVVLVWLDWLVFCEYGFSVSAAYQTI